ncbi:hypothetical protein E4U34_003262 [Claviceps purpurea]|nr:hypothetical protein E4U34_003262 [Claviceps purpurea]
MDEFPSDALPPEAIYSTKEPLREAINSWSRDRGYALTVGRSKLERTGLSFLMGMAGLFATDLIRPLLFIIMLPAFARQLIRLIDSFDLKTKLQS